MTKVTMLAQRAQATQLDPNFLLVLFLMEIVLLSLTS